MGKYTFMLSIVQAGMPQPANDVCRGISINRCWKILVFVA